MSLSLSDDEVAILALGNLCLIYMGINPKDTTLLATTFNSIKKYLQALNENIPHWPELIPELSEKLIGSKNNLDLNLQNYSNLS